MKTLLSFIAITGLILISCNHPKPKATKNAIIILKHLKPGKHCYIALFNKDSASISFTMTDQGQIKGELNINYNADTVASHQPTSGEITGEFRGDTLFADYYFTSGKEKYINPIALLFKNDSLIMGHGKIYYYLGRTYFDNKTPISFNNSRFRFMPSDCK